MFKIFIITVSLISTTVIFSAHKYKRIISIGGSVTEIIYQLGELDKVIASDTSSIYSDLAKKMVKVGYWMRLSSEGILSQGPDLVIASSKSKQPNVYAQIKDKPTVKVAYHKIRQIAKVLGKKKRGEWLIKRLKKKLDQAKKLISKIKNQRILFIYARGLNTLMVSGQDTQVATMIVDRRRKCGTRL